MNPPFKFTGKAILLDIEGTTSSVSFVYDVMFPYVRNELERFLDEHWEHVDLQLACEQIAQDAGHAGLEAWCGPNSMDQRENIRYEVIRLMDGDVKATGLKQLQGLIWRDAFESGGMQAHVYPEVPTCLRAWRDAGLDLRVYSSGSIQAQRLFFAHTEVGDLLPLFTGHYDTTVGAKKEAVSYERITHDWGMPPDDILFISDVLAELAAAKSAGLHTALSIRPGNADITAEHSHPTLYSFDELQV